MAKRLNCEEYTVSFKQNPMWRITPEITDEMSTKNQTQRTSEQIPAAISRKSAIRQLTAIANIKSMTDKPCR